MEVVKFFPLGLAETMHHSHGASDLAHERLSQPVQENGREEKGMGKSLLKELGYNIG